MSKKHQARGLSREKKIDNLGNDQSGQALLEFSLVFLLLMLILMGIIGFALVFNAFLNLNLAVNSAARTGSVIDYANPIYPDYYDEPIYDELVGTLVLLSPDNIVDITIYDAEDPAGPNGSHKDVLNGDGSVVSQNYHRTLRTPGGRLGVQVRYDQPIIVPLINLITGEEIRIVRSASFRLD